MFRVLLRTAAVVLAATGAAAAFAARVESEGGRVTVALSLPWSAADEPRASSPSPEELLAEMDRRAEARETAREQSRADELLRWARELDDRRRADAEALVAELVRLRSELAVTRRFQQEMQELVAAGADPPALPDIR